MIKKDKTYDFQKFKTIRSSGREIYSGIIKLDDALEKQINLKDEIDKFKEPTTTKSEDKKQKKALISENALRLLRGRHEVLNDFKSKIFPIGKQIQEKGRPRILASCPSDLACIGKISDHKHLKILTPKQTLQRLPIAFAQVKVGNAFKNLLNKIKQIIY